MSCFFFLAARASKNVLWFVKKVIVCVAKLRMYVCIAKIVCGVQITRAGEQLQDTY